MSLRVLHIIDSFSIGGAEMLVANSLTANSFPDNIFNIAVVFNKGNDAVRQKIDAGVEVINLNYSGFLKLPFTLYQLRKIIKRYKINLIHSHLTGAGVYSRIAAPFNVKQVHTLHTNYAADIETPWRLRFLERNIVFKSEHVALIFLSTYLQQVFFEQVPSKAKSYVLGNFAEDKFFYPDTELPRPKNKFTIVAVGKFSRAKNYNYLLDIFRHLKDTDIELEIYSTSDNEEYQDIISRENLPIRLMGSTTSIDKLIGGYDLFILPSIYEGYPLSVVEAMAKGVPCFLSNIPSLNTVFKDAALFFELNDPKGVASFLMELSKNKPLLDAMKEQGKSFANMNGKKEKYIGNLIEIYENFGKN